jgi:hypothetical protein
MIAPCGADHIHQDQRPKLALQDGPDQASGEYVTVNTTGRICIAAGRSSVRGVEGRLRVTVTYPTNASRGARRPLPGAIWSMRIRIVLMPPASGRNVMERRSVLILPLGLSALVEPMR